MYYDEIGSEGEGLRAMGDGVRVGVSKWAGERLAWRIKEPGIL